MPQHWTDPLNVLKHAQDDADNTKAFVKVLTFVPDATEHQLGHATIKFFDCLVLKGVKLMRGHNGLWLSFPSRRTKTGDFEDLAFVTTAEMRSMVTDLVKEAYDKTALVAVYPPTGRASHRDPGANPRQRWTPQAP